MILDTELITLEGKNEPYIKASLLSSWLGYKKTDAASQIYNRRMSDFNEGEVVIDEGGKMLISYNGALKICMFSEQPKAREARDEVIEVYRSWRTGTISSLKPVSAVEQAYALANSVMLLAQEQMKQERELAEHKVAIDSMDKRLSQIEAKQNDGFISEKQKAEITVKVREIGQLLSADSGSSLYGLIYTQLYREFGVSSYKNIPSDMFAQVMRWLEEKRQLAINKLNKK